MNFSYSAAISGNDYSAVTSSKFYFRFITVTKIDFGFISTQFFYFVQNVDPAAIYLIPFLIADGAGKLHGGDTAEYFTACACSCADLERSGLEHFDDFIHFCHQLGLFLLQLFHAFVELFQIGRIGLYCQFAGNQIVAGISVFNAYLFMSGSQVVYVLN